jgi:hypothetical protein
MSSNSEDLRYNLGRQQEPEPLAQPISTPPSIWLYLLLFIIALALLLLAFSAGTQNWPGFFLNLSTDIMGAILILIVVDRHLRKSELQAIRRAPQITCRRLAIVTSVKTRQIVAFVQVLYSQMEAVAKPYYMPRLELEKAMIDHYEGGLVLKGAAGNGKTTLLHHFIHLQASELIREPKTSRIPILVSCTRWRYGDAESALYGSMISFYPVSKRTFQCMIRNGRLLCVFDSIDESFQSKEQIEAIRELKQKYPGNAVIISSREIQNDSLVTLGFYRLEIPPLSEAEKAKLMELRSQYQE